MQEAKEIGKAGTVRGAAAEARVRKAAEDAVVKVREVEVEGQEGDEEARDG